MVFYMTGNGLTDRTEFSIACGLYFFFLSTEIAAGRFLSCQGLCSSSSKGLLVQGTKKTVSELSTFNGVQGVRNQMFHGT